MVLFQFGLFLMVVTKKYEELTGEAIIPMTEWDDETQQEFFKCNTTCDADRFIKFVLERNKKNEEK